MKKPKKNPMLQSAIKAYKALREENGDKAKKATWVKNNYKWIYETVKKNKYTWKEFQLECATPPPIEVKEIIEKKVVEPIKEVKKEVQIEKVIVEPPVVDVVVEKTIEKDESIKIKTSKKTKPEVKKLLEEFHSLKRIVGKKCCSEGWMRANGYKDFCDRVQKEQLLLWNEFINININ